SEVAGATRARPFLSAARRSRPQEEAFDQRTDRLAEIAAPRGNAAGSDPVARPGQGDPAAPRGIAQERAGRDAAGTDRLHAPPRRLRRRTPISAVAIVAISEFEIPPAAPLYVKRDEHV